MVYTSAALLVLFAATDTAPSHSVAQDACTEYLGKAAMPHAQQESLAPYLSTLSVIPLENNRSYPFCFVYGGRASSALLPRWEFVATPAAPYTDGTRRTLYTWRWTAPLPDSLQVTLNVTLFQTQPTAADAVLGLRNVGTAPTAAITRPSSLSISFKAEGDVEADAARLYTRVGGNGGPSDFNPDGPPTPLVLGGIAAAAAAAATGARVDNSVEPAVLQNQCGTGSYGTLPFFQVEYTKQRRGT